MNEIPWKSLTPEEIDSVLNKALTSPQSANDWVVDPIICMGGPLYQRLWFISCAASQLAKDYIESNSQEDKNVFLEAFSVSGAKYAGKTLMAFALNIDEPENLTKEVEHNFFQAIFERILLAVNEKLFPEEYSYLR
jgi:hypothetical protein